MKTLYKRILLTMLLVGAAALALATSANAQTTTFDFGIVYDIRNSTQFGNAFGTGTTGASFTTTAFYEETNTTTKFITNLGGNPALLTEFAQNVSPSAALVFSHFGTGSQFFAGSALSGNPGAGGGFWQYVQTLNSNSTTSPNSFQYQVGGVGTQFALDSIGLANLQGSNQSTGVQIIGLLGGAQIASQSVSIPSNFVGGNGNSGVPASVDIVTLTQPGFGDVDSVKIIPTGGNVNVNDIAISPPAVPEPSTSSMIAVGGVALLGMMTHRKKHRVT